MAGGSVTDRDQEEKTIKLVNAACDDQLSQHSIKGNEPCHPVINTTLLIKLT